MNSSKTMRAVGFLENDPSDVVIADKDEMSSMVTPQIRPAGSGAGPGVGVGVGAGVGVGLGRVRNSDAESSRRGSSGASEHDARRTAVSARETAAVERRRP